MGFKKVYCLTALIFILSGCFVLAKKTKTDTSKSPVPVPEIEKVKTILILPFENLSGKVEYDLVAESLPSLLYMYLKFLNSYPFSYEMATLKNGDKFFGFFGLKNPTAKQRKFYIEKSLLYKHPVSLAFYPAFDYAGDPPLKEEKPETPEHFDLKVVRSKANLSDSLKKKSLLLKGYIDSRQSLNFYLYDPLNDKKIFQWKKTLPEITFNYFQSERNLNQLILNTLEEFMEEISKRDFHRVTLNKFPPDSTVYVNGQFVERQMVLLPEGKHSIKAIRQGYRPLRGNFEVTKESALPVQMEAIRTDIQVSINTVPPNSPVFVDSDFVGISPLKILLSEGTHQIRVSRSGFEHANTVVELHSYDKEKIVRVNLVKKVDDKTRTRETVNLFKNIAFYSFFPSLAAFLYTQERYDFYAEKFNYYGSLSATERSEFESQYNVEELNSKYKFYETSHQFFRGSTIFLLITAAVLQIVELEMDDVGIGIDRDKNLGIYMKW
jgi:hypothetical protein